MAYAYCSGLEGVRGFGTVVHCTTYDEYLKMMTLSSDPSGKLGPTLSREAWRAQPGVVECGAPAKAQTVQEIIASSLPTGGATMVPHGTVQRTLTPAQISVQQREHAARALTPLAAPAPLGQMFDRLSMIGLVGAAAVVIGVTVLVTRKRR